MRPIPVRWQRSYSTLLCMILALGAGLGCSSSEEQSALEDPAVIEGNIEESGRIMKDTWEEDRAQGEGVVESAGNAYEGVLEEGRKKADGAY